MPAVTFMSLFGSKMKARGRRARAAYEALGTLDDGDSVHIVTEGEFSFEHLAGAVVDQIGPARLHLSCWVLSTSTAKLLVEAKAAGILTEIRYVIDPRGRKIRWEAMAALRKGADAGCVVANHSKIMVLRSNSRAVVILSSANPNRNRRIESFTVIADAETAAFYADTLDAMIEGRDPFEAGSKQKECF